MAIKSLTVNGKRVTVRFDDPEMPLLYALRNNLALHGPRFGCGLGAMRRLHGARRRQGCALLRHAAVVGRCEPEDRHARRPRHAGKAASGAAAFIEEQAVQCGYCINGMIMESAAFLATNKKPTEARDQAGARQQSLPLRHPCPHRARGQARSRARREGRQP